MEVNELIALGLSLIAGLATALGASIIFIKRHFNWRFLGYCLAFSAGVMIFIALANLLPEAYHLIGIFYNKFITCILIISFMFGGLVCGMLISKFADRVSNPGSFDMGLFRLAIISALALILHNFPEGIATFMTAYHDIESGLMLALAIALHNLPEGIAIALPLYMSGQSRLRAFGVAAITGLSEPLGALATYLVLRPYLSETVLGITFSFVAGIMIFIAYYQLWPNALKQASLISCIIGLVLGLCFMGMLIFY